MKRKSEETSNKRKITDRAAVIRQISFGEDGASISFE